MPAFAVLVVSGAAAPPGHRRRRDRARRGCVDRAHHARARRKTCRTRLHVETELRSALAELDRVVGQQLGLAADALAVHERAVAALEVLDPERGRSVALHAQHRMAAADDVVLRRVIRYRRSGLAPERDLLGVVQRERIDSVDLGAGDMSDDDLRVGIVSHCCPSCRMLACPEPEATQKRIAATKILPRATMIAQHLCRKIAATLPEFQRYIFSTLLAPRVFQSLTAI